MMEESKGVRRAATEITQEESGWTSYFDDFFATQQRNNIDLDLHDDDDDFIKRRSNYGLMVSDAASFVHNENQVISGTLSSPPHALSLVGGGPTTPPLFTKKLNFIKKTRTREISYDDSLEDTASSPVNSPKNNSETIIRIVGSVKEVGFNIQRKTDDSREISSLGKVGGCENQLGQKKGIDVQRDMVDFEGNINNSKECTNLRERGLCLVPMSIFMNYLA